MTSDLQLNLKSRNREGLQDYKGLLKWYINFQEITKLFRRIL